jgi:hypothetical protein
MKTIVVAAFAALFPVCACGQAVSDPLLSWLGARSNPAKLHSDVMVSDASSLLAALEHADSELSRFALVGKTARGTLFGAGAAASSTTFFGLPASGLAPHMTQRSNSFAPPYYAMVHGAKHAGVSFKSGTQARWRLGVLTEGSRHADPLPTWTPYAKRTLISVEYERRAGSALAIVSAGVLRESGALLGTVQPNSQMPGGSARTTFAAISVGYAMTPRWSLVGMASAGRTQGLDQQERLGVERASVSTAAFSVGLSGRQIWTRDDRIGLTLTIPNKVTQGSGSLSGAVLHREEGALSYTSRNLNLAPNATEGDLELSYSRKAGEQGRLAAAMMLRLHPGHDAATPRELLFGVRYSRKF